MNCFGVIVKFALVAPAGTVTVAGTLTDDGNCVETLTIQPPGGAAEIRCIVHVEVPLPPIVVGLRVRLERLSPSTVRFACLPVTLSAT